MFADIDQSISLLPESSSRPQSKKTRRLWVREIDVSAEKKGAQTSCQERYGGSAGFAEALDKCGLIFVTTALDTC